MQAYLEILIVAQLPDDNTELGHEAIVATKGPTHEVVKVLQGMGFDGIKSTRRLKKMKVKEFEPAVA